MKVLFDTNVVLDMMFRREPWLQEAEAIWTAQDEGRLNGFFLASAVTDVFYIARRMRGWDAARACVEACLTRFEIVTVDESLLVEAQALPIQDFEDALQVAGSRRCGAVAVISRDKKGKSQWPIPVHEPAQLAEILSGKK